MKKKYAKPLKFRYAIKQLISFLDAYNGLREKDQNDWAGEIDALRSYVDQNDRKAFDKIVLDLDFLGRDIGDAWDCFDFKLELFTIKTNKILSKIKIK